MSVALPQLLNLSQKPSYLPQGSRGQTLSAVPNNGSTFNEGAQIIVPLTTTGILIPNSMYMAYKIAFTNLVNAEMIGTPLYSPFSNLTTQIGSNTAESISNFGIVNNTLANLRMSVADKYGQQPGYGYYGDTGVPSLENLDGRLLAVNDSFTLSGPLFCALSQCETGLPLFAMPEIRLIFTLDSLSNYFTATVAIPTVVTISNFELRYKIMESDGSITNEISSLPEIQIKTSSFASSTATIAAASSGYMEPTFSMRYGSVRNLVAVLGSGSLKNKNYDSVDLTNNAGDYQFKCGSKTYPQKTLSTSRCRSQVFQELRSVAGSLFDGHNTMSINNVEWNCNKTDSTSPTYLAPAKFFVGTNLSVVDSDDIVTGVSTAGSPISLIINSGASIGANSCNVTLIVNYDGVLQITPSTKDVMFKV